MRKLQVSYACKGNQNQVPSSKPAPTWHLFLPQWHMYTTKTVTSTCSNNFYPNSTSYFLRDPAPPPAATVTNTNACLLKCASDYSLNPFCTMFPIPAVTNLSWTYGNHTQLKKNKHLARRQLLKILSAAPTHCPWNIIWIWPIISLGPVAITLNLKTVSALHHDNIMVNSEVAKWHVIKEHLILY